MPTVVLSSQNYNGQQAQITLTPSGGGSPVNIGTQTLPYTYTATNIYGTYSLFFTNYGITCSAELEATFIPGWRTLDFSCEPASNFVITNSISGLSSPAGIYYDSPTNRLYVMDNDDNARGNIYYFTPSTASTNASFVTFVTGNTRTRVVQPAGTQTTVTGSWLRSPMLYNVRVDPIYKRLYGSGSGTNIVPANASPNDNLIQGLFIYDITGNTLTELVYGNNTPFERSLIYYNDSFLFVDDTTTNSLIRLDRANPKLAGTSIPLPIGVTRDLFNNAPQIVTVGTGTTTPMLWVVNFAGPVGTIGIFNQSLVLQTEITLPGASNVTPGTALNYWNTIYYDKDFNYVYATNIGIGRVWIIRPNSNNLGGTIIRTYQMSNRRANKTHVFNRMTFDPVSNKLYIAHQCTDDVNQDTTGPLKTYEVNRQTTDIVRFINNFGLFDLFPVTNEYGSDSFATPVSRSVGWSTAPWNRTDGSILFYNNNVTGTDTTGIVNVDVLEEYNTLTNVPTGQVKNNVVGDPDYIEPFFSTDPISGCPITYTLNCPVIVTTPTSTVSVNSFYYEVGIENSVKNNPSITQIIICALNGSNTIVAQDVYNAPFNTAYFHDQFSGLPTATYNVGVIYSGTSGILEQCGGFSSVTFRSWVVVTCTSECDGGNCGCVGISSMTIYTNTSVTTSSQLSTATWYTDSSLTTLVDNVIWRRNVNEIWTITSGDPTFFCTPGGPC